MTEICPKCQATTTKHCFAAGCHWTKCKDCRLIFDEKGNDVPNIETLTEN